MHNSNPYLPEMKMVLTKLGVGIVIAEYEEDGEDLVDVRFENHVDTIFFRHEVYFFQAWMQPTTEIG